MKLKLVFLVACGVLLGTSISFGQAIELTQVDGLYRTSDDSIVTEQPVTFHIAWNNTSANALTGWSNGFRFWLKQGSLRDAVSVDTAYYQSQALAAGQNLGQWVNVFGNDGTGADTIGLGAALIGGSGTPVGWNQVMAKFTVTFNESDAHGDTLCIDSCWYPPGNDWLWIYGLDNTMVPAWGGPHCFTCVDESQGAEGPAAGTRPTVFALNQNYPNPFNPTTTIKFDVASRSHVTLTIYNVLGQEVTTLVDEVLEQNSHEREWNAQAVASGIYFYRLEAGEFVQTKKMMLLK